MFRNENNKGANQSAPLLFANHKDRSSGFPDKETLKSVSSATETS